MAVGAITGPTDTYRFATDGIIAGRTFIVGISATVVALFFYEGTLKGTIHTYTISSAGIIGALIDSETYEASHGGRPDVINVAGDVYAIACEGVADSQNTCKVVTISIDSVGNIGSIIDSLVVHDGSGAANPYSVRYPRIIKVSGNIYAINYYTVGGDSDFVGIDTISISSDGTSITAVDSTTLSIDTGHLSSLIKVSATAYAFVVVDSGSGYVKTMEITAAGVIGSVETSLLVTNTGCGMPQIVHIYGDVYLVAYYDTSSDGWFKTYTIEADHTVTLVDTEEWHATLAISHWVVPIMRSGLTTIIATIYVSTTNYGYVATHSISPTGVIGSIISNLRFYASDTYSPSVGYVGGNVYALAFRVFGGDMYLYTFSIETADIYPSDANTRVSGLIHRWTPGNYTLEILLGDVTTEWDRPPSEIKPKPTEEVPEEPEMPPWVRPVRPIPPYEPGPEWGRELPYEPGPFWGEGKREIPPYEPPPEPPKPAVGQRIWRGMTPWVEEKGETVGTWIERIKETFLGGLFKR